MPPRGSAAWRPRSSARRKPTASVRRRAEDADAAGADGVAWSLADAVPVGSSAAVALIEHLWAIPLRAAVHRSGGRALDETWLAPADVERLERLAAGAGA